MTYNPSGPYPPDQNYQWQEPQGFPASVPPAPGYPTSGGTAYPPPVYGYPPAAPQPQPQPARKSYLGLIIALIVGIVVVGCGGTCAVLAIVGSQNPSPHPSIGGLPHNPGTKDGGTTNSGPVPFGRTITWNDKLEASVVSVRRFTPSNTAAGTHAGQVGIRVTARITNNSDRVFDLTLADVHVKSGAAGTQADMIFDSENNLGSGFEGSIAPGHSATADYGFSVPAADLGKLDIEVTPGFDYDPAIFEGSVS